MFELPLAIILWLVVIGMLGFLVVFLAAMTQVSRNNTARAKAQEDALKDFDPPTADFARMHPSKRK